MRLIRRSLLSLLAMTLLHPILLNAAPPSVSISTMRGSNDSNGMPLTLRSTFTVTGIVSVSTGVFGKNSFYIQDGTAGTNVYDGGKKLQTFITDKTNDANNKYIKVGTSITITGIVWFYNGLLEFIPTDVPVFSSTYTLAIPGVKTITTRDIAINGEQYEGQLVKVSTVMIVSGLYPPLGEKSSLEIMDASGLSCIMRIEDLTNIHTPLPAEKKFMENNKYYLDVIGIVSQYVSTAPYTGGYQILPRSTDDIVKLGAITPLAAPTISVDKKVFNPYKGQNVSIAVNTILGNRLTLRIFDTKGRLIKTLSDYIFGGINYPVLWDGTNDSYDIVPPGIYIIHLESIDPAAGTRAKVSAVVAVGIRLQ